MRLRRANPVLAATIFVLLAAGWLHSPKGVQGAEPRRLAIFAPQARYSVEITPIDGNDYVSLFDVVEPLRHVDASVDGKNWKVNIAGTPGVELRFRDKKKRFTLSGGVLDLPQDFRLLAGRGYIPLVSLDWLLTQITGMNSEMHRVTNRLFLGGVATRITFDLKRSPSRLVLSFPFAVNPEIVNEGTSLHLTFSREPIVSSGNDNQSFTDPVFSSTSFAESAHGAELLVKGNVPLTLSLADSGKTVVITGPQVQAPAAIPAPQATAGAAATPPPSKSSPPRPGQKTFVVAIDAAHGGGDTGAMLSERLLEKDVTLAFARRLAHELQARGVPAILVRTGDSMLTSEQRAVTANTAALSRLFISLHVSRTGDGVRVYRAMLPQANPGKRPTFVSWQSAQSAWLEQSSGLSGAITSECSRRQIHARAGAAALPTLNSIAGPAVAIEIGAPPERLAELASADFQQSIAAAVANAIAAYGSTGNAGGSQ